MSNLLIRGHLGLGDALVCNALVRDFAKDYEQTIVLCKLRNLATEAFMWRDLRNVEVFAVHDDPEADAVTRFAEKHGFKVLKLGFFGPQPFDVQHWDSEFYRQAGVPFSRRWSGFHVEIDESQQLPALSDPYCLIHDDRARGFAINDSRLPRNLAQVRVVPGITANLFNWWRVIENATELHMIDSCVASLADSMTTLKAKRKVFHDYARKNIPATLRSGWEYIK